MSPSAYGYPRRPYAVSPYRPRRRRKSRRVYVRRRILALILSVGVVFLVLFGLDRAARAVFTSKTHAPSATRPVRHKPVKPAPAPATVPTTPAGTNPVTISAVGEVQLGSDGSLPPDPATYLKGVKAALAAPIVFGDLDGDLTTGGVSKCAPGATQCYAFRSPPSYATYLRKDGFTVLSSANNHAHDYGPEGVTATTAALRSAGIAETGLPGQIGVVADKATKVAFVAFAPYTDTNNLLDLAAAKALIERAKTMAPIVVVYMHAGAEGPDADQVTGRTETFDGEDRGNPEAFAHAAIDDGADAVVGSGPEVLRGMQFYKGHLIAYSLGNFATYGNFAITGNLNMSGILRFTLSPTGAFESAHWQSVLLESDGQPTLDPDGAAAAFVNQLSASDFGGSAAVIQPNGSILPATASATGGAGSSSTSVPATT